MKKLIFLLLIIITSTICFSSCDKKYKPVDSTEEEKQIVATMQIGGEKYEVKYELYRMLFLSNKSLVDGGDDSVWSSEKKEEYISQMDEIIYDRCAEIFSVFAFAKTLGINPYSTAVEDMIYEYVVLSVEGNNGDVQGHGSYDKFLASLKERNMNYSVMELLLRYSIVSSFVYEKYRGVTDEVLGELPGEIDIAREDIESYYFGDECVRVLQMVSVDSDKMQTHREKILRKLADGNNEIDVALYMINNSTAVHTDLIIDKKASGIVIGKYALDTQTFGEYRDTVFSMDDGELSEIVDVSGEGYYIAYKLPKSEEHFERCYDAIRQSYIDNAVGRQFESNKLELIDSIKLGNAHSDIVHSAISMG